MEKNDHNARTPGYLEGYDDGFRNGRRADLIALVVFMLYGAIIGGGLIAALFMLLS